MNNQAENRVAVITGAANGIGLALTKHCLQKGIRVLMADSAALTLNEKVKELQAEYENLVHAEVCDVRKPEDLRLLAKNTIERFTRIDWLFNNAGISGLLAPIWELHSEDIQAVLDVNLYGIIHGIQAFLPLMFKAAHRSRIINIASFYGLCSGSSMAAYSMSKHAILALSESLHFDLQRLGKPVDVSVVCPSFADTQLLANFKTNKFQSMLNDLLAKSRPAEDIAAHIIRDIEANRFYILPDREVKDYALQRVKAIIEQTEPYKHNIEKLMSKLLRRAELLDPISGP